MADIGVSFIPTQDNQQPGGNQQGELQGDLAAAYKILSLRLPSIVGAGGIAPNSLLQSQGAIGVPGAKTQPGGFNPYAALFEQLLKHGLGMGPSAPSSTTMPIPGGPSSMPMPQGTPPVSNVNPPAPPSQMPPPAAPSTRIIPGGDDTRAMPNPNPSPTFNSWMGGEGDLGRKRFTGY